MMRTNRVSALLLVLAALLSLAAGDAGAGAVEQDSAAAKDSALTELRNKLPDVGELHSRVKGVAEHLKSSAEKATEETKLHMQGKGHAFDLVRSGLEGAEKLTKKGGLGEHLDALHSRLRQHVGRLKTPSLQDSLKKHTASLKAKLQKHTAAVAGMLRKRPAPRRVSDVLADVANAALKDAAAGVRHPLDIGETEDFRPEAEARLFHGKHAKLRAALDSALASVAAGKATDHEALVDRLRRAPLRRTKGGRSAEGSGSPSSILRVMAGPVVELAEALQAGEQQRAEDDLLDTPADLLFKATHADVDVPGMFHVKITEHP